VRKSEKKIRKSETAREGRNNVARWYMTSLQGSHPKISWNSMTFL
jgi:hypothetical protein